MSQGNQTVSSNDLSYEKAHSEPQWAKISDLKAGDTVELHGFDCAQGTVTLHANVWGDLYFECADGWHYIDRLLDAKGYLVGITIRPSATIIPITQESPTMSDFNPDDANAVSRFFQGIADKVVLASTLPKEVEELRASVEQLKKDVESYREHMARADEEISNLRRERAALQDENAQLRSDLAHSKEEHHLAETRWNNACNERDKWHDQYVSAAEALDATKRERDDAQLKIMELEDSLRSKDSELSHIRAERDELYTKLNSIRSALT